MNQIIKIKNINLGHKIIIYFLFVGITLALITGSAYCLIDLRISPTISLEEGELKLDRLKMEIAGEFFGIDSSLILDYRQRGFRPEDIVTALFSQGIAKDRLIQFWPYEKKKRIGVGLLLY
jgi:hypothetical protein